MANDYIPNNDAEFNQWQKNFLDEAASLDLPGELINELNSLQNNWSSAYNAHLNAQDAARAATAGKEAARANFVTKIREGATMAQANPSVSEQAKVQAGLPIYKKGRTPAPVPSTRPMVNIDTSQRLTHTVHFMDEGSTSKAKPKGVAGAQVWVKVGDTPPASEDELRFLGLDTRTPYAAHYDFDDAGKTAYYMLRWVNTRGEHGPWSETVEATIQG